MNSINSLLLIVKKKSSMEFTKKFRSLQNFCRSFIKSVQKFMKEDYESLRRFKVYKYI